MYQRIIFECAKTCKIQNNFYQVLRAKGNFCAERLSTALLIVKAFKNVRNKSREYRSDYLFVEATNVNRI